MGTGKLKIKYKTLK